VRALRLGCALSKILVLVSGNGTTLQALLDAQAKFGDSSITAVLSDRPGAYALERARLAGIPALLETPDKHLPKAERRQELSGRILNIAREYNIYLIVLAGFLSILEGEIVTAYSGRIINMHPALLPKYGGLGMYGNHVHQAVLDAGEKESGCTVHLVDAGTDTGPILLQHRVPVLPGDNVETLAERIHREEHIAIVEAVVLMLSRE
jgi:phosphoribosylglycinamide formyltransferase-1